MVTSSVKKMVVPRDNWLEWKIKRVMKTYDTYDLARRNLSKSTYTSDLSECDNSKRISKRRARFSPQPDLQQKQKKLSSHRNENLGLPPGVPLPTVPTFMNVEVSASPTPSIVEDEDTAFTFHLVSAENNVAQDEYFETPHSQSTADKLTVKPSGAEAVATTSQ
ncbi:unnamed protein product, partial [Allacma fusca]